ncbi:MAG: tRNA (N6-isopentenyl adenosine(37)-C2)-methylthiotransferase MiaB [Clostridiales bacterium]|jgi:tRNA-2-methylthio-N6-dimethylallyladenosine synthase|nr:tRNA (N6-isopentenyl adenosine(37)-C2)-methylthiotransferase MiaB [Clostridiales bacterium]
MNKTYNTNEFEANRQLEIINELKSRYDEEYQRTKVKKTFHIVTFGCQMNSRDSEKISGILKQIGYIETDTEDADFVLYNTCTVRENANNRVFGRLGHVGKLKKNRPGMLVAVCGCMMQETTAVERVKKSYPFVDIIFGTHNIFKLAELIKTRIDNESVSDKHSDRMVIDLWKDTDMIVENLPNDRKYPFKAGVNIIYGCNNFCSYCIVPYVRGRERSRNPEDILEEIRALANDGVKEVMLLGQNVNSYGKNLNPQISFAQLLKEVEKIDKIKRIRFMTSHPKDLSQELIDVMGASKKICRHLHLPLQSGSTRLLKIMNRKYTKEDYLDLVDRIRKAVPDISLTTDIIVGFPGETEEDFMETIDVVKKVGFDNAFTFLYSKRAGTPAANMECQVDENVAKERFDRLLDEIHASAAKAAGRDVNSVKDVLVEEVNSQNEDLLTGRLSNNMLVHFPGDKSLIGEIIPVYLEESKGFYYIGKQA